MVCTLKHKLYLSADVIISCLILNILIQDYVTIIVSDTVYVTLSNQVFFFSMNKDLHSYIMGPHICKNVSLHNFARLTVPFLKLIYVWLRLDLFGIV